MLCVAPLGSVPPFSIPSRRLAHSHPLRPSLRSQAAIAALPDEITYFNNLAAVYFEMKKYDECIEQCKKGIEAGRAVQADFKIVAKSFARMGNAYKAMDKLDEAGRAYEDSLMEDRVADVEKRCAAGARGRQDAMRMRGGCRWRPELCEA